jgi:hypothetical protein
MIILRNINNRINKNYLKNLKKEYKIGLIPYRLSEKKKEMPNLKDLKKMKKKEEKLTKKNINIKWMKNKKLLKKPINNSTTKTIKLKLSSPNSFSWMLCRRETSR